MEACRILCKAKLDNRVLLDLFLKTLMVEISKDVAQQYPTSEEDAISKAQKLELIYTQSWYIYNILPNTPRLQNYQELPGASNFADGLIGSMTKGYLGKNSQNLNYAHNST